MKVAVIPYDMAWGDISENLVSVAELLRHVEEDTDLVVLPEMFTTGFITDPSLLSAIDEEATRYTLDDVRRWTNHFGYAICGSFVATERGLTYNRGFIVEPCGDATFYDKHHLFSMGGEARSFTQGEGQSPVLRYRGVNVKLLVCYDLRFPVWARNIDCEYDLLIYVANWPDARHIAWETLLRARAIENQAYVIGCNRTGADDFGTYSDGHSYIIDDYGRDIARKGARGILYADIDPETLHRHRSKFPVYRDADPFTLSQKNR